MNRGKENLSAADTIRVAITRGNSVLVQLEGTGFTGTVDFKSSPDGGTWTNHPYVPVHDIAPAQSVAQITDPTGPVTYLIIPPVTAFRIDVAVSAGSIEIVYREIL